MGPVHRWGQQQLNQPEMARRIDWCKAADLGFMAWRGCGPTLLCLPDVTCCRPTTGACRLMRHRTPQLLDNTNRWAFLLPLVAHNVDNHRMPRPLTHNTWVHRDLLGWNGRNEHRAGTAGVCFALLLIRPRQTLHNQLSALRALFS